MLIIDLDWKSGDKQDGSSNVFRGVQLEWFD